MIGASRASWGRRIDGWALFAFAAGTCFLFGYGQLRTVGIIMVASVPVANSTQLQSAFRRLFPVPPELWLYSVWVVWVGLTGWTIPNDTELFLTGFRVLAQVFVMVWASYAILRQLRGVDVVFLALITGTLVQIGLVLTGIGQPFGFDELMDPTQRLTGSTYNPNSLGFMMVWCVLASLYFWQGQRRWALVRWPLLLSIVATATYFLLATGSRKSALTLALVLYSWAVFGRSTSRGARKAAVGLAVGLVLLLGLMSFGPDAMKDTAVGRRFDDFLQAGGGDVQAAVQANVRYAMYVDGLRIFGEHPMFGVGLNNFGAHFYTGQYSHSDLIEPLATTGLIGFILYESFYVLLLLRAWRLLRVVQDTLSRYRLRMVIIGIMAIFALGLGAPHYADHQVFLLLTAFSVFTSRLQEEHTAHRVGVRTVARGESGWWVIPDLPPR